MRPRMTCYQEISDLTRQPSTDWPGHAAKRGEERQQVQGTDWRESHGKETPKSLRQGAVRACGNHPPQLPVDSCGPREPWDGVSTSPPSFFFLFENYYFITVLYAHSSRSSCLLYFPPIVTSHASRSTHFQLSAFSSSIHHHFF